MTEKIELVVDEGSKLGEGALWHAQSQKLLWIEIEGGVVHSFDPATGKDRAVPAGQKVGTVVPRASGGLMLAVATGFASFDMDSGKLEIVADPESKTTGNRFNDGKCDPAGRFWAGTIGKKGSGSLYCLAPDFKVSRKVEGVSTSNGIVWSLDARTMYFIDTAASNVVAYDYDRNSGDISNKKVAIDIDSKKLGWPDGMTIDSEGMLWIAHWEGAAVRRWDPLTGKLLHSVDIPANKVTSCAFGGPALDDLYVTTANYDPGPEEKAKFPKAGGLFRFKPGVKGITAFEFAG